MKPIAITIHPASAAIGAAIIGLTLLANASKPLMGATLARPLGQTPHRAAILTPLTVHVEGIPRPQEMVRFDDLTAYTVPVGKILVTTALARGTGTSGPDLQVDGVPQLQGTGRLMAIPTGFAVSAGSTVTMTNASQGDGRAG